MTASIIDDEYHAIEILSAYIGQTPGLILSSSYTDPLMALRDFDAGQMPDLVFLDLDMPGLPGLEAARILSGRTAIILTTSFRQFGPEAFELAVTDYLLKPFSFARFQASLVRVQVKQTAELPGDHVNKDDFFIKSGTRLLKVAFREILYIKSDRNYLDIHTTEKVITTYSSLHELESSLPAQFLRVHRSYIVNLDQVKGIEEGQLRMRNGSLIGISEKYRHALLRYLQTRLISPAGNSGR